MTFKIFAVRLGCFCLDLNLRMHNVFCSAISIYEVWKKLIRSYWHERQYHKWKSTLFNIYMDTYHSCYGLQVKDIYENEAIHCAYWTKKTRLFTMNLFSMLTCITETVFPSEKRELTSNCNRHLIIISLCTSIWKTCHCFPTANHWSISSISGQC